MAFVMLVGTAWFLSLPFAAPAHAASTLTVTTTADPSSCTTASFSLRCALNKANTDGSGDTIAFNIPTTSSGCTSVSINGVSEPVCTLTPTSSTWPSLTANNTTINGYTQTDAKANTNALSAADNAILTIRLNGGSEAGSPGLLIQGTGELVEGLSLTDFSAAIETGPQAGQATVQGDFVGLQSNGVTTSLSNIGVEDNTLNGNGLTLGGTTSAARNVISGNLTEVAAGNHDTIQGNFIGLTAAGNAAAVNFQTGGEPGDGLLTEGSNITIGGTTSGAGNVISGNSTGLDLESGSSNLIEGNLIGTDVTGKVEVGNEGGISMISESSTTIGGTTSAARNIISGNFEGGVDLDGGGNVLEGNYIGTDITGEVAVPNGNTSNSTSAGVVISNSTGASNDTIGGTTRAAGNIISGNALDGVLIDSEDSANTTSQNNVVEGNFIGTDATGTKALGNGTNGVFVGHVGSTKNLIEGNDIRNNLIADNGQSGILIGSSASDTNLHTPISENEIFSNGGLGIDLAPQGTVNTNTAPPGPNDYTHAPVITSATTTTVSGTAPANTTVEVFLALAGSGDQGHGGGEIFLNSVTASSSGTWSLTLTSGQVSAGQLVTATTTTTGATAETSEFAANVTA
jgi:trimeric autotransporter adhesin